MDVLNEHDYPVDATRLQQAVETTLRLEGADPESMLTVVLMSDDEVARLNRRYRGVDAPTDVLSFPADAPPIAIPGEPPYLGDLILAIPYATAQAETHGHVQADSLALLVVHGCLHLLGYDHDTAEARATMWRAQEAILNALQIPLEYLPALEDGPEDEGFH